MSSNVQNMPTPKSRLWQKVVVVPVLLGAGLLAAVYFLPAAKADLSSDPMMMGLIALGVVVLVFVSAMMARDMSRQANSVMALLANIEAGNTKARAEQITGDEVGCVAASINLMLDNNRGLAQSREERDRIQKSIMKLLEDVGSVAHGDLTREAEVSNDVTGSIAKSFNQMITELRRIISKVQDVSEQVSTSAKETQVTTEQLAEGSEEQALQITNTSSAIEQMVESIQQVSENAVLSATVAEQSMTNAKQGSDAVQNTIKGMSRIREQVQETAKRMKQLGERSQEIGEFVQLIDEIADRTSILALNASIQASMAGEAGRAFAVVAEEVERLAERSAEATKKIANLVKAIQTGTTEAISAMEETTRDVVEGSKLANQAGQSLTEIESVSSRLAELVQSISLASRQQARGSEDLSKSMADIAHITHQTASGAKHSAATVKSLATLADELRSSVASFKVPHTNGNGNGHRHWA